MLPPSLSRFLFYCMLLPELVLGQIPKWTTPPHISCPEGSKAYGSFCYGVFQQPKTWSSAELNCQSLTSGHLSSLMNESEAAFVAALATQSLGENCNHLWIFLHNPSKVYTSLASTGHYSTGHLSLSDVPLIDVACFHSSWYMEILSTSHFWL
ncbi:lithostathine-like [Notamacropus eugenii]|uniref:lithostathine-like n=1 Tax=Notamacropus eugenii TaxID=9315 RepID=UPI003B678310